MDYIRARRRARAEAARAAYKPYTDKGTATVDLFYVDEDGEDHMIEMEVEYYVYQNHQDYINVEYRFIKEPVVKVNFDQQVKESLADRFPVFIYECYKMGSVGRRGSD